MLRNQLQILSDWYAKGTGRKPIILRGARQVGKSTLVRLFAQEQGLTLIEVNLEKHPHLDAVFKTLDVNKILRSLEAVTKSSNWTRDRYTQCHSRIEVSVRRKTGNTRHRRWITFGVCIE